MRDRQRCAEAEEAPPPPDRARAPAAPATRMRAMPKRSAATASKMIGPSGKDRGDARMTPAAVLKIDGEWAAAEPEQNELAGRLDSYDPRARKAYLGALHALQQDEYPDQLAQAAHSLREVIDLLARRRQTVGERKRPVGREERKALLQETFDPLARQSLRADDKYDLLASMYGKLSEAAHHGQASAEEVANILVEMEEVLGDLTTPQIAVNEEMDALLSRAPSACLARRLIKLQSRWATQLRLVEAMQDHWLPHMREAGFFSNPPPASTAEPPSYTVWPPSLYLRKCTEKYGREVAEIILASKFKSPSDRNPAVYIDFLECALSLPLPDAERIASKALQEAWGDFAAVSILDDKYMELAARLYMEGKYCVAAEMVCSALSTRLLGTDAASKRDAEGQKPGKAAMPLNLYWLEEVLSKKVPPLARKNPWPIIEALGRILVKSVAAENQDQKEGRRGAGADSLLDYSPDAGNYTRLQAHKLIVDCVVDCIRDCLPKAPDAMERLRRIMGMFYKEDGCEFRRIELASYAEFPDEFSREISTSLLIHFDRPCTRDEYRRLLKASFGTLSQQTMEEVLRLIEGGFSPDKRRRPAESYGSDDAAATEGHWKLKQLHAIKDHLWGEHLATYSGLCARFGKPDQPDRGLPRVTFHRRPAGGGSLAGKSASQVFAHIKERLAGSNEFTPGSDAGMEFEEYVKSNPEVCSKMAAELEPMGETAQRCLLAGLDGALQAGGSIDWDGTMRLIEHIVGKGRARPQGTPPPLANAACMLVERGLKKDLVGFGTRRRVWAVLEALAEIGTENAEREECPGRESALDVSLNGINGVSFHAVCQYAAWCKRNGGGKGAFAQEARSVLDFYLDKRGGHTVARHAVLGLFLPIFHHMDRGWAMTMLSRIPSGKETKIAFWDGYVSHNGVHPHVFKDLLPWYSEFLGKILIRGTDKGLPYESTVAHAMLAYFYGLEGANGLVKKMLAKGGREAAEVCAHQVGIMVKGKGEDGDFDKEKLVRLWKDPSLRECDLTMWFVNSPLDGRRSVSLYKDYIAGRRGAGNPIYDPIDTLGKYAGDFPAEVAECLDILLDRPDSYVPDKMHAVLERAIGANDRAGNEKCRTVIEKAAQKGRDWRDLLG